MKLKDKKIELLRTVTCKDGDGFGSTSFVPVAAPLWAYFRQLSGKEIHANSAAVATEQVLFIVNWRSDLNTALVVRYKGVLYDVCRVDVFEGYKSDIALYCKLRSV